MNQLLNICGKKKRKAAIWFVISFISLTACTNNSNPDIVQESSFLLIEGETQGTTYGIKIIDSSVQISKAEIDSVLHDFDMSLSGYIPESVVCQWNDSRDMYLVPKDDIYFLPCLKVSTEVFVATNGAFDPTVLPLMQLWGFLKDAKQIPNQTEIDSVLQFVGYKEGGLWFANVLSDSSGTRLSKKDPQLKFDFNAIAQGYSVDVIADFIRSKGAKDFYIEIGGEIYVEGKNPEGNPWRLGIDKPVAGNDGEKQRVISAVISVTNKGVATSGNYRKFYKKDGRIYAHTMNPKTGRPAENELLSVTVVAKNTAISDGMATAFMVMGLKEAKEYLKTKDKDQLEVLLIYTDADNILQSFASEGMKRMMEK